MYHTHFTHILGNVEKNLSKRGVFLMKKKLFLKLPVFKQQGSKRLGKHGSDRWIKQ